MTLTPVLLVAGRMLAALPIFALVALTYIFYRGSWRDSALRAAVVWGTFLVLLTECLSLFHRFNVLWLAVGWATFCLALALISLRRPRPEVKFSGRGLLPLLPILIPTLILALYYPTNNYDSLTYHMPRVVHWAQNASVANFPTNNLRQLNLNPGAEYVIAHLQILAGGDWLANLVQWFSMAGSLAGVSLIAERSGADPKLAAIFAATLPMGVLQSTTTQNDWAVSFWLVCLLYFILEEDKFGIGGALGLALLTKGTAYILALPFCLLSKSVWRGAAIAAVMVLALNAGFYARNYQLHGWPLPPGGEGGYRLTNDSYSPKTLLSNVSRNLALHASMPSDLWNRAVTSAVYRLHQAVGADWNDPRTTWWPEKFAVVFRLDEDVAGNPLHLLLILVTLVLFRRRETLPHLLAFLLFCLLLRWQPWHSRLLLPLFVLWAPLVARAIPRKFVFAVLLAGALPFVFFYEKRPFSFSQSRQEAYFLTLSPEFKLSFQEALRGVGGCERVGLTLGGDDPEYLLWVSLPDRRFTYVNVRNESAKYPQEFEPCAVIGPLSEWAHK